MPRHEDPCCPPAKPLGPLPRSKRDYDEQVAGLCKALGHPARVAIMRLLLKRESCVCGEIVHELPLAQATVSQHLKKLKEAGLIRGAVEGQNVCYCVESAAVERLKRLITDL